MTVGKEDTAPPQIIIIRRGSANHEEGHHGGVWKIAYADFMTAMMAFFLVMWLVNAANRETKRMVASYFNPLKLTERISAPKGLQKLQPGGGAGEKDQPSQKDKKFSSDTPSPEDAKDGFSDDERATDKEHVGKSMAIGLGRDEVKSESTQSGQAFVDPFGIKRSAGENRSDQGPRERDSTVTNKKADKQSTATQESSPGRLAIAAKMGAEKVPEQSLPDLAEKSVAQLMNRPQMSWLTKVEKNDGSSVSKDYRTRNKDQAAHRRNRMEREEAIKSELALLTHSHRGPTISVLIKKRGLLVSLMDNENYEMFRTGSSKPNSKLIDVVSRLSAVLKKDKGMIVVSGHTDARPYRTQNYNNWRLSFDRAHAVLQMLKSSGINAERFARVEGHAASQLRDRGNPNASSNRRVELFIRMDKK